MDSPRFYRSAAARCLGVAEGVRIGLLRGRSDPWPEGRRSPRRSVLVALALVLVGVPWVVLSDGFYVYEAETIGARRLASEQVLVASELVGRHVLSIRPSAVEASLLAALPTLQAKA